MLSNNITEGFDSKKPKLLSFLLLLNIIYSIFTILLIAFSITCYSSFNEVDEEDINYFIIKKKLIGQIIVNSFIFIFLIIIIIDNLRLSCILKKNNISDNNNNTNSQNNKTNTATIKNSLNSTERHLNENNKKKKKK